MKSLKLFFYVVLVVFFISCDLEPFGTGKNDFAQHELDQTEIVEKTDLFISDSENNKFVFSTNEIQYLSNKGFTLWAITEENKTEEFESIEYILYKESGNKDAGYGLVFCQQKIDGKQFLLCVMISATGNYCIGRVVDGSFSSITKWKTCTYLNKGYGAKNILHLSYKTEDEKFVLKINDNQVTEFTVEDALTFKGSHSGFVVVLSDREQFPENPVRVIFEK